jgi:hemoglobin/transferrin/lactoferrin receptor protein
MNYRLLVAQVAFYPLLFPISGLAQPPPTDSTIAKTEFLNQIVVSENRSENLLFQTPSSITVLDPKSLKTYLPRTLPEALIGINGVFVQKTNHGGGSPFLRGLTGNQTLILIDGIRLNNSTFRYGPNQYLNTIDPFSVAKIEVLKGSGSVQYGTDAIGGTIQMFTTEPDFDRKLKVNVLSRIATQKMEHSARGELSYGTTKYALSGAFGVRSFGDLVGGTSTGVQRPSGYKEQTANLKTKTRIGRGILTLAHQYFEAQNIPIYHKIVLVLL